MVNRYKPSVKRTFDLYDDEYYYTPKMEESKTGEYVKHETYNSLLKEHNKLKKKLEYYENQTQKGT